MFSTKDLDLLVRQLNCKKYFLFVLLMHLLIIEIHPWIWREFASDGVHEPSSIAKNVLFIHQTVRSALTTLHEIEQSLNFSVMKSLSWLWVPDFQRLVKPTSSSNSVDIAASCSVGVKVGFGAGIAKTPIDDLPLREKFARLCQF